MVPLKRFELLLTATLKLCLCRWATRVWWAVRESNSLSRRQRIYSPLRLPRFRYNCPNIQQAENIRITESDTSINPKYLLLKEVSDSIITLC